MTTYEVNKAAVTRARQLIDSGSYDDTTEWAEAAPSAAEENAEIDQHGYDGYGE